VFGNGLAIGVGKESRMAQTINVLGVIPARLHSSRLPGKVLRPICGVPMVVHVWRRARACPLIQELIVATDSAEVVETCRRFGVPAELTREDHPSGTDRAYEVLQRHAARIVVNVQGDEPLIAPDHITALLKPFDDPSVQVSTLRVELEPPHAADPNCVKVVCDLRGRALYFSRAAIPFDRDRTGHVKYYKHLGLYAYRAPVLAQFCQLGPSPLEQAEKLEQLRLLEHGIPIHVADAPFDTVGVDTEEDLQKAEQIMLEQSRAA